MNEWRVGLRTRGPAFLPPPQEAVVEVMPEAQGFKSPLRPHRSYESNGHTWRLPDRVCESDELMDMKASHLLGVAAVQTWGLLGTKGAITREQGVEVGHPSPLGLAQSCCLINKCRWPCLMQQLCSEAAGLRADSAH